MWNIFLNLILWVCISEVFIFRSLSRQEFVFQEFVFSGVCLSGGCLSRVCLSGVCLSGVCHGAYINIMIFKLIFLFRINHNFFNLKKFFLENNFANFCYRDHAENFENWQSISKWRVARNNVYIPLYYIFPRSVWADNR